MIEPLPKKRLSRATLKSKRREIEQGLAAFGFMPDLGRFMSRPSGTGFEETYGYRLRKALESLGPVFSAFGLYLSSRVDLLPVHTCLDLSLIASQVEAKPISAVRDLIAQEFGCPPQEMYLAIEEVPFESQLMFQSHHALLKNGQNVMVKIVHSEWQEQFELDMELLTLLNVAFIGESLNKSLIENTISEFRYTLHQQIDLTQTIKAFEDLHQDSQEFELLRVPTVYKDLSSPTVVTIEQLAGQTLEDVILLLDRNESEERATTGMASRDIRLDPNDLAHRLCLGWLRQALLGNWFPVALDPKRIVVLPNKQIAFTGGEFARLPSDAKKNLWNYLIAASTEDPDKACSWLLREMIKEGRPVDEDELRHRFRGIVPFRDGGWSRNGDSRSLAEHLFVHWKLMSERGLRPQHHLIAFYRGLFQTAANARRLEPHSDPLLEGLQGVRTIEMLAQFRDMIGLSQLSDNLDKYTAMTMGLPQRLNDALTLIAEGSARVKLQGRGAIGPRRPNNSSAVVIALLLALAAVTLFSHHLATSAGAGGWLDRISAIVFVLLGTLLLRVASHGR
jgi:predicted unusual protein kinase regulating ubiquinone biosynthesis (AarF/ABC1/UbiB family)